MIIIIKTVVSLFYFIPCRALSLRIWILRKSLAFPEKKKKEKCKVISVVVLSIVKILILA